MGSSTTNLGLYKPDLGETGYADEFATSMDTLDAVVGPLDVAERYLKSYEFTDFPTFYRWDGADDLDSKSVMDVEGFYFFRLTGGDVAVDPGWIDGDPFTSTDPLFGATFPANTTVAPPRGLYQWHFRVNVDPAPATGHYWADLILLSPGEGGPISVDMPTAVTRDAHSHTQLPQSLQTDPRDIAGSGVVALDDDGLHVAPYLSTEGVENDSVPQLFEFTMVRL
jgi:hypothetical protein